MGIRQAIRFVRQDLPSLSLLKRSNRNVAGHLVTMHQSGSHWLQYMLTAALCNEHNMAEPEHIRDRSVVGRPQDPIVYPQIPRLIQSHFIPSPLVHSIVTRNVLRFPRYVILVRDMRAAMVSLFEKKKDYEPFQIGFSAYLRGSQVINNPIKTNLWRRIRFLNAWHRDRQRLPPQQTLLVHYEQMKAQPAAELQRVWEFLGFAQRNDVFFHAAVAASSKERMAQKEEPQGEFKVVRADHKHPFDWFNDSDREFFSNACRNDLVDSFGYDYDNWSSDSLGLRTARAA